MDFFRELVFVTRGDIPRCGGRIVDKKFEYYGIQYNHAGNFQVSVDGEPFRTVNGPHVLLTSPFHRFDYGAPENEFRWHCFLCFRGSFAERLAEGGVFPRTGDPLFRIEKPDRFYGTFRTLYEKVAFPGGGDTPRAALLLTDLLLQIQEQSGETPHASPFCVQRIRFLCEDISRQPQKEWDFHAEAAALSVSDSHFRRVFRETIGMPPRAFLTECRMNLAMKLLITTTSPVHEIAELCGYRDEYYFSRMFRSVRKTTPSGYRKEFAHPL